MTLTAYLENKILKMNKLTKYITLSAAAMALVGCANDEPYITDDNIQVGEDGTLVTDHVAFKTQLSSFDTSADGARSSAIYAREHKQMKEWEDKETGFFMSSSYMEPTDQQGKNSRGFAFNNNSYDVGQFDSRYGSQGIRVSASFKKDGQETNWINDQRFYRHNDGVWRSSQPWYWPRGAEYYTLYAFTPIAQMYEQNGASIGYGGDGRSPYLDYTTPNYSGDQQDIMVAKRQIWPHTNGQNGPLKGDWDKLPTEVQPFQFKHIMAGLRIRVAIRPGRPNINRFDINGVPVRRGKYYMSTGWWDTNFPNENKNFNTYTSSPSETNEGTRRQNFDNKELEYHIYNDVMSWEQTFMLIPQTFNSGTELVIFWKGGGETKLKLDGLELKAGQLLYLDIQEPSIFEEGMKSFRELPGDRTEWPQPEGGYVFFRLYEDKVNGNYYETPRPVCFNWRNPANDQEDKDQYFRKYTREGGGDGLGDYEHFGNRLNLNVLTQVHGGGHYFFSPKDMRVNFFIFNKKVTYDYTGRMSNTYRESYIRDSKWNALPDNWSDDQIKTYGAPWNFIGGELNIKLVPDKGSDGHYPKNPGSGKITFTPTSTSAHPINFPRRICVCGSVNRFPFLIVEPFGDFTDDYEHFEWRKSDDARRNLRSYRDHCLRITDNENGIYEGDIIVNQYTPSWGTVGNNGLYIVRDGWYYDNYWDLLDHWIDDRDDEYNNYEGLVTNLYRDRNKTKKGFGVVMFYLSTLHGSYGHGEHPCDEYESRLGVVNNWSYEDAAKRYSQDQGTIYNFGHTYTGSFIKLKCGKYHIKINLTAKTLEYKRTGDIFDQNNIPDTWKAYRAPHKHVRYFWYDVYKWNYTDWYTFYRNTYWIDGVKMEAGSYYYSGYNNNKNAETAP